MKKMKCFALVLVVLLTISVFPLVANAATETVATSENQTPAVTPRKPIIEWHYKIENGKIYRRQFNHTTGQWIGQWELCP